VDNYSSTNLQITPKQFFDDERQGGDYRRLFVNKGWKSVWPKRGYVTRHDDKGVYLRHGYHQADENLVFVVYADIMTIHVGNVKLVDVFCRPLWDETKPPAEGWHIFQAKENENGSAN
jgi:hypothetical protein